MLLGDLIPLLGRDDLGILRTVAGILLPGDDRSPAATALDDLDEWLASAVRAIGREGPALGEALHQLPEALDWDSLKAFAEANPVQFDLIATVAAGAYFMSPTVLSSIGYPHGPRRAPRVEQAADDIETGVLDDVMARESMVREVPA